MKEFIEFIAKHLVDNPGNVSLEELTPDEKTVELTLKVGDPDIGLVVDAERRDELAGVGDMLELFVGLALHAPHQV